MISLQKATFGAGCFWGVEDIFGRVKGVVDTAVGYMGGSFENPTYKDVCGGKTGHVEVAQITYDPELVSYEEILKAFWELHDPTTKDRQGPDIGAQYRSAIFFHSPEQEVAAIKSKDVLEKVHRFSSPIVTEIVPVKTFWRAEEYHQKYFEKNGGGVCHI